jgi:hypothetical protein
MKFAYVMLASASEALAGCGGVSYKPVVETGFDRLVADGCTNKDARLNVRAMVSSAFKETVVLSDPADATRTLAVRIPAEGLGSKTQGVFGKSRYEVALEKLRQLKESGSPITASLLCTAKDRAPTILRIRYLENGNEKEIEFQS